MRKLHPMRLLGIVLLASLAHGGGRAEERAPREEKPLEVKVDWRWVALPGSPGSAVHVCVASSGEAYSDTVHSCRPADLKREFRLPKTEYLLGEPIVVQLFVAVEGPGMWFEWLGGNYRRLGRDDNFLFLLRSADGTWVPDPYESYRSFIGGGIACPYRVALDNPFSYWLAVQRWAALQRPGVYDLFAVHFASRERIGDWQAVQTAIWKRYGKDWVLAPDRRQVRDSQGRRTRQVKVDLGNDSAPSPNRWVMSPELREKLGRRADWVQDFEQFRISVRQGTHEEVAAMATEAVDLAGTSTYTPPPNRADATREAIWFVEQDCFLPTLADWMHDGDHRRHDTGLAMNPSTVAQCILFDEVCRGNVDAQWYLPLPHVPNAIPALITRLDDPDPPVRGIADRYLRIWTGLGFGPVGAWRPHLQNDPTAEEGRTMRAAWERWWTRSAATFRPVDPWARHWASD